MKNGLHAKMKLWIAIAALPVFVLAGCRETHSVEVAKHVFPVLMGDHACGPFTLDNPLPQKGTSFIYKVRNIEVGQDLPGRMQDTILANRNGITTYERAAMMPDLDGNLSKDKILSNSKQSIGGILKYSTYSPLVRGYFRSRTFSIDPLKAIADLKPGERITIPSKETSRFDGDQKTVDAPIEIAYEGCKHLTVMGEDLNTSVYKLHMKYRVLAPSGVDQVSGMTQTVYYSDKLGWWVLSVSGDTAQASLEKIIRP